MPTRWMNAEAVFDIEAADGKRIRGGIRAIQLSELASGQGAFLPPPHSARWRMNRMFVVVIGTALAGVRPYLRGERRVCRAAQTVCETPETHLGILDFGFGCGSAALGGPGLLWASRRAQDGYAVRSVMKTPQSPSSHISRRTFFHAGSAALVAPWLSGLGTARAADGPPSLRGRLYKTLKIGMVDLPGSLTDKFKVLKEVGFDGVEMDCPGMDVEATRKAISGSGLPVDGTVCSTHWSVRHSDPNPTTRVKALADLETALRATHAVGGHTVLLVVGHGNDGSEREVWERSVSNIRQVLPLAARLGVYIAIENVWNHFLYQHDGPADQSADKLRDYVDELNSPWVGVQFDIGNHQKYGKPAEWVRTLGRRIVKLDVKDWGVQPGWSRIGDGDVDWPAVCRSLLEIGYTGWAAAEVEGGGRDQLRDISQRMDRVFGLA